jgi:hypothetical protein
MDQEPKITLSGKQASLGCLFLLLPKPNYNLKRIKTGLRKKKLVMCCL